MLCSCCLCFTCCHDGFRKKLCMGSEGGHKKMHDLWLIQDVTDFVSSSSLFLHLRFLVFFFFRGICLYLCLSFTIQLPFVFLSVMMNNGRSRMFLVNRLMCHFHQDVVQRRQIFTLELLKACIILWCLMASPW